MVLNELFLYNLFSGFNGFVKFFILSFLMCGFLLLLIIDDKFVFLDQNRFFENNGKCRYIFNKVVSKKVQNLFLDIDCLEIEYEFECLFNGMFDLFFDSFGKNDNLVVRFKFY